MIVVDTSVFLDELFKSSNLIIKGMIMPESYSDL